MASKGEFTKGPRLPTTEANWEKLNQFFGKEPLGTQLGRKFTPQFKSLTQHSPSKGIKR